MNNSTDTTDTSAPDLPSQRIRSKVPGAGQEVKTKIVVVSPHLASRWLERNRRNRRVREDRVTRYAEQIEDGEWMLSPDAIAFDYNGSLINGQHRLKAIIEANEPAPFIVAIGLEPDAFKISDVGVKRTGGDILRIEGFKNPEELAAATRLMVLWSQDRSTRPTRTRTSETALSSRWPTSAASTWPTRSGRCRKRSARSTQR